MGQAETLNRPVMTPAAIAADLSREYRDCHALTTAHPAAIAFAESWAALKDEERRAIVPSGTFPKFDSEHSGPICRKHAEGWQS